MFKWFKRNKKDNIKEEKNLEDQLINASEQKDLNLDENAEEDPIETKIDTSSVTEEPFINDEKNVKIQETEVETLDEAVIDKDDDKNIHISKSESSDKTEEDNREAQFDSPDDITKDLTDEKPLKYEIPIEDKSPELINEEPEDSELSLFARLKKGLSKTRTEMGIKLNTVLGAYVKIDDEMMEDLEDILISADIGMETTMKLVDNLQESIKREKLNDPSGVNELLKIETKKLMNPNLDTNLNTKSPSIILVIGVNGVGKTTTIGKLAFKFRNSGQKVLIAAADTFRAAAIDQLKEWGNRANVDVISHKEGADPGAVIFDAIKAAKSRNIDILICDTAGRLHNKSNLMKELEKIDRIITKEFPEANRETLLVLDGTTGQNALSQAKTFKESCDITGIALTKLDGTAKGGVAIALQSELQIPIKLIGVGETVEDLQKFDMNKFVDAIFE